jgi:hypothetical protein
MPYYEDDIRAAFHSLAGQAPDAHDVLTRLHEQLDPAGRLGHRQPAGRRRSTRRLLIPLAAALAVIAVIATSVALRGGSQPPQQNNRPAPILKKAILKQVPKYYMFLRDPACGEDGHACTTAELDADVISTRTGDTVATLRPPRSSYFVSLVGAADDRAFVLFVAPDHWTPPKSCGHDGAPGAACLGSPKPYLAQVNPADGAVRLRALPIPGLPPLSGLAALSPNGTELAYAAGGGNQGAPEAQVHVYSLTSGTAREWQDKGSIRALAWGPNGQLGIDWDGATGTPGIEMLNTNTAGGSLLSASRLAVDYDQPDHYTLRQDYAVSGNGKSLVTQVMRVPYGDRNPGGQIRWYSLATGDETRAYTPSATDYIYNEEWQVLWSNSSGSVTVLRRSSSDKADRSGTFGVLSGNTFVPLPVPLPVAQAGFFITDPIGF